jgi:uracil-DNA glycosylase
VRGEIKASGEFFQNRGDAVKTHRLFNFLGYADYIINRCYPDAQKIKTFTIFHPSYLMRQPMKKKVAWKDMLELEKFLAKF